MKAKKHLNLRIPLWWPSGPVWDRLARWLLPSPGSVLFTLLAVGAVLFAQQAGALPMRAPMLAGDSTTTISYQGRLADSAGNPVNSPGIGMQFCLYDRDTGGAPLNDWCENHTAVPVEDGLFHVLLGSINPIQVSSLASHSTLWLGITVGSDSEMVPREQVASVPYAMIASTVSDGSITTAKIADGAVTADKLAPEVAGETVYTLTLADWASTTSDTNVSFGTIDLPMESNLYVMGMWVLQNDTSDAGLRATLKIDETSYSVYGDEISLSHGGIGYVVARNYYIPNIAAGSHIFSVHIDQPSFQSGETIKIGHGSVMWIRAVPRW